MEEIKLNDDVFEQIKDFGYDDYGNYDSLNLTEKQELLIDKLILNEELKERYKKYGLCNECKQPNTYNYYTEYNEYDWCQQCNAKRFQQNFQSWTSGNH